MRAETSNIVNDTVVYELPLNDAARMCLQLENLFHQFDTAIAQHSELHMKNAMTALLKILEVSERPDMKSKLCQTLVQFSATLDQLNRSPQVDKQRLQTTLKKLDMLSQRLNHLQHRIGEELRENEFLYHIRSNLANPGGVSDYRLPAYLLWQKKSYDEKTQDLKNWMQCFQDLRDIVESILLVTRESTPLQTETADNGFYHQNLNPSTPYYLIRVALFTQLNLYPEFGAGKHRLTIRFLKPSYYGNGRPTQTQQPVPFQLSCCRL